MATLTMTPTRQPLGCLNSHMPRMSMLNRQNQQNVPMSKIALLIFPKAMSIKSSMKSSIYIDNSENVNPALSTKRKRSLEDEDKTCKPVKTSRIALSTRSTNTSPRLSTPLKTSTTTPKSAPILKPAGRSPPPKSSKSATRHRLIAKPRADQNNKRGVARPFSLASVLSQSKTPKPAPKIPASWCFDIHVDTEQEEMTNLMQHSTTVLDISDDEGKAGVYTRGKENIPPQESGIELPTSLSATATPTSRKADMMEESRAPLGELRAADYYAEDCNAFSYVAVYDDEEPSSEFKKTSSPLAQTQEDVISSSIASVLEVVAPKIEETNRQHESTDENAKPAL
ncbi:hypothetical protein N7535_002528 [Penicillium sp. DV-2018c]|nr:hypothetical protein N7535_002528 [Penicillium sp. DV-2018c]